MEWLNKHTKPNWPLWCRRLVFGGMCIALPLMFIIALVLTCALVLTLDQRHSTRLTMNERSFNVTYVILNDDEAFLPAFNAGLVDYQQLSQSFQSILQLPTKSNLQIEHIFEDQVAQSSHELSRCDFFFPTINDLLVTFQFRLYDASFLCQNQSCWNESNFGMRQWFENITSFPITVSDDVVNLYLCSIDGFSQTDISAPKNHVDLTPFTTAVLTADTSSQTPSICTFNSSAAQHRWIVVGNMSAALMFSRSTYIHEDNSILITGGTKDELSSSDTIQKYLIANQSFATNVVRSMKSRRMLHTADALSPSGLVLLTGGAPKDEMTAELLNPISGQTRSISMLTNRRYHTSVPIPLTDQVILTGGEYYASTILSTGDLFNGTHFAPILNSMTVKRIYHTATYIPTLNKVLIVGGRDDESQGQNTYNTVEFYDVASNRFEALPNVTMFIARARHTATYIPSPIEKIIIIGGENKDVHYLNSCEVFDVKTRSFVEQSAIGYGRYDHHAILLNNNNDILITDGASNSLTVVPSEVFSLKTMSSCQIAPMNIPRERFTATLIPTTGEILACGGRDNAYHTLNSCELYARLLAHNDG